jgi:hypothetical protein
MAMRRTLSLLLGAALAGGSVVAVSGPVERAAAATTRAEAHTADADFDGDGWADLATTSQVRQRDDVYLDRVHVLYGGRSGISRRLQTWSATDFGAGGRYGSQWATALAAGDFDGDGYSDLAIGGVGHRAGVRVLYGSRRGLSNSGTLQLSPALAPGGVDANWQFGTSLTAGNFGRGGADDLAIGSPANRSGVVLVLYGTRRGLTATGRQAWSLRTPGLRPAADPANHGLGQDGFGTSLAVGRFAGGAYDDLAVGAPSELVGRTDGEGAVHVLRGSKNGLTVAGNQVWTQNSPGIGEIAELNDDFGSVLTTGDFQDDGRDDLVIATPSEFIGRSPGPVDGNHPVAGLIHVLYGSSRGLTATGSQVWSQNSPGVKGVSEDFDRFGRSLAAGQFGKDPGRKRYADLAIGVAGEDVGSTLRAGGFNVLYGSKRGLTAKRDQFWTQNRYGVKGRSEYSDGFGYSLVAGQFGRDKRRNGYSALAVSAPNEVTPSGRTGAVSVLYATGHGLSAAHDQAWYPPRVQIGGDTTWFGGVFAANGASPRL